MKLDLYGSVNDCAKQFSLLDFGLLKLCVGSAGVIAGALAPKKSKKNILAAASLIFAFTLLPLMIRFVRIIAEKDRQF